MKVGRGGRPAAAAAAPRWLTVSFVASVPVASWATDVGVSLTLSHWISLGLMGMAAWTWFRYRPPLVGDAATAAAAAFIVIAAVSAVRVQFDEEITLLGESSQAKSLKQLVGLAFGAGVLWTLTCLLRWFDLGLVAVRTHYWTTVVVGILTLAQFAIALTDLSSPLANIPVHNDSFGDTRPLSLMYGFPRVSLTLVEPAFLATYLTTGWALWVHAIEFPSSLGGRFSRMFVASGIPLGAAIVVTGSRLAYVVAGLVALTSLLRPGRLWRASLLAASTLVGFALIGPQPLRTVVATLWPRAPVAAPAAVRTEPARAPAVPEAPAVARTERSAGRSTGVVDRYDSSIQWRVASYRAAWHVLSERPLFGAGLGTSSFYMHRYWPASYTPLPPDMRSPPTMLSHYAAIAAETGLAGLLCLAAFALAIGQRLRRLARRSRENRMWAISLAASLGSYAVACAATGLMVYQILLVWVLVAAALTAHDAADDTGRVAAAGMVPRHSDERGGD